MSHFRCDIRNLGDSDDFARYLQAYDPSIAPWAKAVTIHHTYKPDEASWRGERTMYGIRDFYISKGWTSGPHLFIAPDGIWQLTALNEPGTHVNFNVNKMSWGIEVVGFFDDHPWSDTLRATVYRVTATLLRWRSLPANYETLRGHREWGGTSKTCPGRAINMSDVRADVAHLLQG